MTFRTLFGTLFITTALTGTAAAETSLNSYILLDRTGSMSDIWDEALSSVNAYVESVIEADDGPVVNNDITLAVFDAQDGFQFDVLRENVTGRDWSAVTRDEVSPRGMTPLFDAIGRIAALAETDAPENAVIVIMTDGLENSSREYTHQQAKAALDRAEKRGWQIVFLGAEFARFNDADAVGVARSNQMAVSKDRLEETMYNLAKKNRAYAQEGEAVEFDEADRALAEEEVVKQRDGTTRSTNTPRK